MRRPTFLGWYLITVLSLSLVLVYACSRPTAPSPTPSGAAILWQHIDLSVAKVDTLKAALIAHDPNIEPALLRHLHPMNCEPSCQNDQQNANCAECENPLQYLYTTYSWTVENSCGAEGDPCYWAGVYYDDGSQYWVVGNCGYMYNPNGVMTSTNC